ncbi:MAG: GAF domain-containing protein, partial [Oxalobacteraceae bacterium]
MLDTIPQHVREIQAIAAVPRVLETVATMTGLGFVCIAHVTDTTWTTCAVHDELGFGLQAGDPLDVTTTLCEEVRATREPIVIDSVRDSDSYRDHNTPRLYGFQSYFSIPIFRPDGDYFGTLCGLDPEPAALSDGATMSALTLFAELISRQLETDRSLRATRSDLLSERETAELREQFIAVLGHDLRTPLSAILTGAELLKH